MKIFKNQRDLFEHIWNTREHVSELSGDPLLPKGHFQWHWQFLHILPKGSYPHYRLNIENIVLGTVQEHENQEMIGKFNELKSKLKAEYYEKYYNVKIFD
jgi:hypothetical protein